MQRSCSVKTFMRCSIFGSSLDWASFASVAPNSEIKTVSNRIILFIINRRSDPEPLPALRLAASFVVQLTSQRQNLFVPGLVSDWSNLFETNHAFFIDQKAFRRTINSVVDRCASFGIVNRLGVGIAGFGQGLNRRRPFVAG